MAVKQGVYGGVSAADRKIARRIKLLDATLEVWGREGGPPVTMTRVCAEAGLTERYFYESFTGLGQAQIAVVERVAEEIADRTVAALESTAGGPTERVRAAIGEFVQIL
ncbi:MAG: TetR/AcrR family transcriptional regulator, partial [Aeromicrobium sp.]